MEKYSHRMPGWLLLAALTLALAGCGPSGEQQAAAPADQPTAAAPAGVETFTAIASGNRVGQMEVSHDDVTRVGYEYRNNGRGPSIEEVIEFGEDGFPERWQVTGATTFGNQIDEIFRIGQERATWTDAAGSGEAAMDSARLYVSQGASPYALWVYARLLLAAEGNTLPVLPAGQLSLTELETLQVTGDGGEETITTFALSGINLNPTYFALDESGMLFATMSSRFALVRQGFEAEEERLRELSVEYSAQRFESMQQRVTRNIDRPVRINNVRLFDPQSLGLTEPASVLVADNRIVAIDAPAASAEGEVAIDGAGGTLLAGMYEMHGHLSQESALLNLAAGVTSVRDMGNQNEVLAELIAKIESGRLVGPRITRSGFIEGRSPFNASTGVLVSSQEEALDAVRRYANGDFYQIKIYNSMNPDWVPAMVQLAKSLGLRVAGHVPAFSNADAMIAAGYDEMTHINQVMLGWVLDEGEDTRTLLRLTALKRLPRLNMSDANVRRTIDAMANGGVAMDPTLAIHENLLLSRNGNVAPGMVDYVDHMPVGVQRSAREARAEIASPEDDQAYRGAFDKIIETVATMRERGVFIVPGTDLGGSFTYHRELELYQLAGMTPAEILKMATYDMAAYLGQDAELGSIEVGKLADFFLVPGDPTADLKAIKRIALVMKDGEIFFPSEIYPEFGIVPFVPTPLLSYPD